VRKEHEPDVGNPWLQRGNQDLVGRVTSTWRG
jgi:hypothetical protein